MRTHFLPLAVWLSVGALFALPAAAAGAETADGEGTARAFEQGLEAKVGGRLVSEAPPEARSLYHQAIGAMQAGETASAERLLGQATAVWDGYAAAWYTRARLRFDQGLFSLALADLEKALALKPKMSRARFLAGAIMVEMERFEPAIVQLQSAVEYGRTDADARFLLGLANYKLDRDAEAVRWMGDVCRDDGSGDFGSDPIALFVLGHARLRLGDREKARLYLNRLLLADPGHADARQLLESIR